MRLVLFDMDHTLVPADTGSLWSNFLFERDLISAAQANQRTKFLDDYRHGRLDPTAAYHHDLAILMQLNSSRRLKLLDEFFKQCILPLITNSARAAVTKHRAAGDTLVIITATLEEIAAPVAAYFAVDALIAGRGTKDDAGNYTGQIEFEPCMGHGKLVHLEAWLVATGYNPEHYTFYSDSHNDIPLLEQVDVAIAVDPDPELKQLAQSNGWPIISFLESK